MALSISLSLSEGFSLVVSISATISLESVLVSVPALVSDLVIIWIWDKFLV